MTPMIPAEDEVLKYFERFCNWGRWGDHDEKGTLNFITPEKRLQALRSVRSGVSISCAWPIVKESPVPDVRHPPLHFMLQSGETPGTVAALDFIGLVFHGHTITHVDALSHQFWQDKLYNNRPSSAVNTLQGATWGSVEAMKDGIFARGVLLDIPRLKGRPYLEAGEAVFPEDLDAAEKAQGVRITQGDALLLRTGWLERREKVGVYPEPPKRPGLHAAAIPWLYEREVSVVCADAAHDVTPSGYSKISLPIHMVGMTMMGLCLIDSCQLEDLANACEHQQQWDFLFVVAPLRWRYATGSPVSPLAIL